MEEKKYNTDVANIELRKQQEFEEFDVLVEEIQDNEQEQLKNARMFMNKKLSWTTPANKRIVTPTIRMRLPIRK